MDPKNARERVLTAQSLLFEPAGSLEKFFAVKKLVAGIDKRLDGILEKTEKELTTLENVLGHHYVLIGMENLPENTDAQKKRKEAILYFWKTWNELKAEVSRVYLEVKHAEESGEPLEKVRSGGRILGFLRGPMGSITILALLVAGFAYWSSSTSVAIVIRNTGCPSMVPTAPFPDFIPGISLPNDPIKSGQTVEAHIPTIPLRIEDKGNGNLVISSLILRMNFNLGSLKSIQFDNMELLGHITEVDLGKQKQHFLEFICS